MTERIPCFAGGTLPAKKNRSEIRGNSFLPPYTVRKEQKKSINFVRLPQLSLFIDSSVDSGHAILRPQSRGDPAADPRPAPEHHRNGRNKKESRKNQRLPQFPTFIDSSLDSGHGILKPQSRGDPRAGPRQAPAGPRAKGGA